MPTAAIRSPENAEVIQSAKTGVVLAAFAARVLVEAAPLTAERFKAMMKEVQKESGVKGKELYHPVRVMLTGAHSGPEFDKLIPLIEEGSQLQLPRAHPERARARRELRAGACGCQRSFRPGQRLKQFHKVCIRKDLYQGTTSVVPKRSLGDSASAAVYLVVRA